MGYLCAKGNVTAAPGSQGGFLGKSIHRHDGDSSKPQ